MRAPVGWHLAATMSSQMDSAFSHAPLSAAARMADTKACTEGDRRDPAGASRMRLYMPSARFVSPLRVQTSSSVVHMRLSGSQPAATASSHTCTMKQHVSN